jgi:hypothetical protein
MMKPTRNRLGLGIVFLGVAFFKSVVSLSVEAAPQDREATQSWSAGELRMPVAETALRAQAAAEQALEEVRRVRLQNEALREELNQLARELAALREAQQQTDFRTQPATLPETRAPAPVLVPGAGTLITEDRLAELEDQVAINTTQLREHAQTKIETERKYPFRVFGALIANTYFNSNSGSLEDVPLFALPTDSSLLQRNNLGATLRQTTIGFALNGPRVDGARLSAEADFDFWGGRGADVLGSFRLRTVSARLDWEKTGVNVGLFGPLISPRNPNSLAAVWLPPLTGAGNLWQWRPQLNVERRFAIEGTDKLVIQGGLLPTFGERIGDQTLEGPPAVQARVAWTRSLEDDKRIEAGFGAQQGSKRFGFGRNLSDYVIAGDWQLPLGSRVELSGEAYHGRSITLSESSGGSVDRLYAFKGQLNDPHTLIRGVRSSGGWIQLSVEARRALQLNFAYGQEDPNNVDIRSGEVDASTRLKNQVSSANFIYKLRSNVVTSLEYRRLRTHSITGRYWNNHLNLAVGYLF